MKTRLAATKHQSLQSWSFHTCNWPNQSPIAAFCRHQSPGSAYQQTVVCR